MSYLDLLAKIENPQEGYCQNRQNPASDFSDIYQDGTAKTDKTARDPESHALPKPTKPTKGGFGSFGGTALGGIQKSQSALDAGAEFASGECSHAPVPSCRDCLHLSRPGLAAGYCSARTDLPPAYGAGHPLRRLPDDRGESCTHFVCCIDSSPEPSQPDPEAGLMRCADCTQLRGRVCVIAKPGGVVSARRGYEPNPTRPHRCAGFNSIVKGN